MEIPKLTIKFETTSFLTLKVLLKNNSDFKTIFGSILLIKSKLEGLPHLLEMKPHLIQQAESLPKIHDKQNIRGQNNYKKQTQYMFLVNDL